jgi:hypothetical protein
LANRTFQSFEDPANFHKVLLLRPRAQSPTADIFLFVPVSAQVPKPGETVKPVLFQIQVKGVKDLKKAKNTTWLNFQTEVNKSLYGDSLEGFHNVFLLLADKISKKNFPCGVYKNTTGDFSAIVASPDHFLQWAKRREWVPYAV